MSDKGKREKLMTPRFRASFPHLFEARAVNEGGEKKFSICMLFPKDDPGLEEIKAACERVGRDKFGKAYDSLMKTGKLRMPFRDGTEKEEYEGYGEGVEFANATALRQPGVVDQKLQRILDPGQIYAGSYCRATVTPFAYDVKGNKGVSLGLNNVQLLADGDRLDGGASPESEFDAVEDEPDPLA